MRTFVRNAHAILSTSFWIVNDAPQRASAERKATRALEWKGIANDNNGCLQMPYKQTRAVLQGDFRAESLKGYRYADANMNATRASACRLNASSIPWSNGLISALVV